MNILTKLTKLLLISISIFLSAYFFNVELAYAGNNSFAKGTLILTPDGNIPIEKFQSGDRVIGYDFSNHQQTAYQVNEIKAESSFSYYFINNKAKITGTNFVYTKTPENPIIVRVQQLQNHDKLIGKNHGDYVIETIEQIVKPSELYEIILDNETGNFFADNFLVYGGNKIPLMFRKNYISINCKTGYYVGHYSSEYRRCVNVSYKNLPGIILAFILLVIGSIVSILVLNRIQKSMSN